jgi:hypothetical protein
MNEISINKLLNRCLNKKSSPSLPHNLASAADRDIAEAKKKGWKETPKTRAANIFLFHLTIDDCN